jgi:hypothetical protein
LFPPKKGQIADAAPSGFAAQTPFLVYIFFFIASISMAQQDVAKTGLFQSTVFRPLLSPAF